MTNYTYEQYKEAPMYPYKAWLLKALANVPKDHYIVIEDIDLKTPEEVSAFRRDVQIHWRKLNRDAGDSASEERISAGRDADGNGIISSHQWGRARRSAYRY
jgi:hypothetical protein